MNDQPGPAVSVCQNAIFSMETMRRCERVLTLKCGKPTILTCKSLFARERHWPGVERISLNFTRFIDPFFWNVCSGGPHERASLRVIVCRALIHNMSPRIIPLSGGDRKVQAKGIRQALHSSR